MNWTHPPIREVFVDGSLVAFLGTVWFAGYLHRKAAPKGLNLPIVISLAIAVVFFFFAFLAFALAE